LHWRNILAIRTQQLLLRDRKLGAPISAYIV
jgi:hypothetical protein